MKTQYEIWKSCSEFKYRLEENDYKLNIYIRKNMYFYYYI